MKTPCRALLPVAAISSAAVCLAAKVLSPIFTPDRVKMGAGDDWLKKCVGSSSWATRDTLRAFIGPNWAGK